MENQTIYPTNIKLRAISKMMEISFSDGRDFVLSCELLRVYSPSAEVRGHSPEQAVLQVGKQDVTITEIEQVGNYAVKLVFDDGHDTGLYTWSYLYDLASNSDRYWKRYLAQVESHEEGGRE